MTRILCWIGLGSSNMGHVSGSDQVLPPLLLIDPCLFFSFFSYSFMTAES